MPEIEAGRHGTGMTSSNRKVSNAALQAFMFLVLAGGMAAAAVVAAIAAAGAVVAQVVSSTAEVGAGGAVAKTFATVLMPGGDSVVIVGEGQPLVAGTDVVIRAVGDSWVHAQGIAGAEPRMLWLVCAVLAVGVLAAGGLAVDAYRRRPAAQA